MIDDIYLFSAAKDRDLELILEDTHYPVTKAEIIHIAKAKSVSEFLLYLLHGLPSRFYWSRNELLGQCVCRSLTIRQDLLATWKVDPPPERKGGENGC